MTWLMACGILFPDSQLQQRSFQSVQYHQMQTLKSKHIEQTRKPMRKNPPCCHRFEKLAIESLPAVSNRYKPNTIIEMTAVTLIMANQNSDSP